MVQRQQLLLALLSSGSFDEACMAAGVTRGAALLTRSRDAVFAAQWDEVVEARMAEVDARLIDLAVHGLARGLEPGEDARQAIALGKWIVEGRHGQRRPAARARPAAAATAKAAAHPGGEVARLFDSIGHKLRMAEKLSAG